MDIEDRDDDEERGRGRLRARKEDVSGTKIREDDVVSGEERDMEI
jgi:hypothetical protein